MCTQLCVHFLCLKLYVLAFRRIGFFEDEVVLDVEGYDRTLIFDDFGDFSDIGFGVNSLLSEVDEFVHFGIFEGGMVAATF